jgi:effector-binding domain-containing protein
MTNKCEIYDQVVQPTLAVRTRSAVQELPRVMGETLAAIGRLMENRGVQPGGAPYTAYYNMDMQDLDIEIGFPVNEIVPGDGAIQAGEMPAGKYASVLHKGTYDTLGQSYEALTKFIEQAGYKPSGVAYEFYLNSPVEVAAEDLRTQVVFPIIP